MKLTYVFHSGFVIEGEKATLIFDYFKDSGDAYIRRHLASFPGRIYVLSSHSHPDHYRKEILQWRQQRADIRYIFSRDILLEQLASPTDADYVEKGQVWSDDVVHIRALGSTDIGVSFLAEVEGRKVFHAGDLNNWHWKEESTEEEVRLSEAWFLKEVKDIQQIIDYVDVVMFPVDPCLGKDYMLGAKQFITRIRAGLFSPMHFGVSYAKAHAFQDFAEQNGCRFAAWKRQGESIEF